MNVFCWLGWNEQSSVIGPAAPCRRPHVDLDAVAELRARSNPEVAARRLVAERSETDDHPRVRQRGELPLEERRARVALGRQRLVVGRCALHGGGDPGVRQLQAVVDRHRRRAGWRGPALCIARNSQSPLRSPVNTRPVRFAPCAAGARPSTTIRACGSPKPGIGRPQYTSSRYDARFSTATNSRHSTSRGHARHVTTSASSCARGVTEPDSRLEPRHGHHENVTPTQSSATSSGRASSGKKPDAPGGHHDPARPARPDADDRQGAARTGQGPAPRRRGTRSRRRPPRNASPHSAGSTRSTARRSNGRRRPQRRSPRPGDCGRRSTAACSSATSATGRAGNSRT